MVSGAIRTWPQDVPAAEVRTPKTAEALYLQLRNVGLDKSRVYRVREGSLDRSGLHKMAPSPLPMMYSDTLRAVFSRVMERS